MENKNTVVKSVGLCDLILVTFIVLKLTGVIAWSWWWVLAPLWMPLLLSVVIILALDWWAQRHD